MLVGRYIAMAWYRFTHDQDLYDEAPGLGSCSTVYPIWRNGNITVIRAVREIKQPMQRHDVTKALILIVSPT